MTIYEPAAPHRIPPVPREAAKLRQLRTNKYLGIALTADALLVAEIHRNGDRCELTQAARFVLPNQTWPANLVDLGRPLALFLKQKGFTAKHVLIGLPASLLVTRSKEIPPTDLETAVGILRLQAESEFAVDARDLIYDFAGTPDRQQARSVLLLATYQSRLQQLLEMAHIARLNVDAITPSIGALGQVCQPIFTGDTLIVQSDSRSPTFVESAYITRQGLARIRHSVLTPTSAVSQEASLPAELVTELRRTLASLPANNSSSSSLLVFLGKPSTPPSEAIDPRLGVQVQYPQWSRLGLAQGPTPLPTEAHECTPAIALALLAGQGKDLEVNFLKPRLAPPRKHLDRRLIHAGLLIGIILAVALGYFGWGLYQQSALLAERKAALAKLKPAASQIRVIKDQVDYINTWKGGSTRYLDCLYQLTRAFPTDGSAWAVTVDLQPTPTASNKTNRIEPGTLNGQLLGKANNPDSMQYIANQLKQNKKFKEVKSPDWRAGERTNSREFSFTINFTYAGTE